MAKGQIRSNKETRKPKKEKEQIKAPRPLLVLRSRTANPH